MQALFIAQQVEVPPRLHDFNLQIQPGEVLGLLGINGAGKSTALAALAGALASQGSIKLAGETVSPRNIVLRQYIGWLPQHSPLHQALSIQENLSYAASIQGIPKRSQHLAVQRMLETFSFNHIKQRMAHKLSGGQQRRLALACSLVHNPKVLLLDEPTAGLDPIQAENLRTLISTQTQDRAVILASHLLDDIEQTCNRVMLLEKGRVISEQTLDGHIDLMSYLRTQLSEPEA